MFRKELREGMTPAEAFLWSKLKARQFEGKRFRASTVSRIL